jgi:hypothetical protein
MLIYVITPVFYITNGRENIICISHIPKDGAVIADQTERKSVDATIRTLADNTPDQLMESLTQTYGVPNRSTDY